MTISYFSFEQLYKEYKIEQEWLFHKHLRTLDIQRNLILLAEQGFGIQEYVHELGFQLEEKNPDIQICYMDISPVRSSSSFQELFAEELSQKFPEVISRLENENSRIDTLNLPALIAKRKKSRIAIFLANAHLFHRFKDPVPFLMTLKLKLRNQKNCVFCLYGNNTPYFRDLVRYPGPLCGFGQLFHLRHTPLNDRSTSIRKLFHDHHKKIGYTTSVYLAHMVNNHPFYLKLLAWHALIRTQHTCTYALIEKALTDLILHYDFSFHKIIEDLTLKQIRFLKAIMGENQKIYSQAIRDEYQLGSTSNVARIKLSLEKREIIYTGKSYIEFVDPIFREWLRRQYFGIT